MLEKITNVPTGIEALKAVGTISKEDYEQVVETLLDEAVLPVNFLINDGLIVLRTGEGSKLSAALRNAVVAFRGRMSSTLGRGPGGV
jgi:predicted nucleic-acid-binding protein